MSQVTILLVSGSTWADSPHSRVLHRLHRMVWPGARTDLYDGMLDLPPFVPGAEREPVAARDLLDRIDGSQAVLFSTPEYAGGLPGALKNLLDWTMGGTLEHKPVAWLDVGDTGLGSAAHGQLRTVLVNVGARVFEPTPLPPVPSGVVRGSTQRFTDDRLAAVIADVVAAIREERHDRHPWI